MREEGAAAADVLEQEEYLQLFERLAQRDPSGVFRPQLEAILAEESTDAHYGVYVDAKTLLDDDYLLGHLVLRYPETMLNLLSRALVTEQERLVERPAYADKQVSVKPNLNARVRWLPGANRKPNISSIRSIDVNAFVQVSGTVTRSGSIKVLEAVRVFECNNERCAGLVRVFASKYEVGSIIEKPTGPCPTCRKSSSYTELKERAICHDYQELKVQEQVQKLGMGSIPRSITVLALHDLVDKCKAGDDVVITGVPINRWSATYVEERCNLETVIDANSISVVNASSNGVLLTEEVESKFRGFWRKWARKRRRPMHARDLIVGSICPQVYGMFTVKLAVALSLVGSPAFVDRGGTRVRGEPHLLLVGDPGTGKSQFLRYAAKLSPRSVLTTGTGTTSAGLTCSAVKEGHEFMLEAGALVLADRGICCIDEFGSIRQHDRATIHEAMEQQTLSVAKAGLVCSLKTRTTIIAATNPRGRFDPHESLSTNTGIAPPLLSRFDMVLVLLDRADESWDQTVSEFILRAQAGIGQQNIGTASAALGPHIGSSGDGGESDEESDGSQENGFKSRASQSPRKDVRAQSVEPGSGLWNVDTFQAYLTYIKRFTPQLSPEAGQILTAYYKAQRLRDGNKDAGRTTLRLLEALIRLAKAHARLMARNFVVIMDAVVSISMIEESMRTPSPQDSLGDMSFSHAPEEEMLERTLGILHELDLDDLEPIARAQHSTSYMLDLDYPFDVVTAANTDGSTTGAVGPGSQDRAQEDEDDPHNAWNVGREDEGNDQDGHSSDDNDNDHDDDHVGNSSRRKGSQTGASPPASPASSLEESADEDAENPLGLPTQCGTSRLKRKPPTAANTAPAQRKRPRRKDKRKRTKRSRSRTKSASIAAAGSCSAEFDNGEGGHKSGDEAGANESLQAKSRNPEEGGSDEVAVDGDLGEGDSAAADCDEDDDENVEDDDDDIQLDKELDDLFA
ncbi:DNA replication licensing factor, putative [Hondaea fermentalgiana]|uniref:DNA helicase n=1 Tax=Hondaea fermentalgiana TaxID=2315210 RepID=A0A2R5GF08_9STRA|nr:DNA replication licensing factor, putative [Hondaea fermentalgiana]|eukprot:GBG29487.1 DNA replication licensing factor, putative [Hondaea fermentalgiana]